MTKKEDNAMLTQTDREFLRGETEYTGENAKQMRYERRDQIRRRVRQSLKDFTLLFDHVDEEEAVKILNGGGRVAFAAFEDEDVEAGLRDTLAFILREAGITCMMGETTRPNQPTSEQLLLEAFKRVGRSEGYGVSGMELEIDSVRLPRGQIIRSLEEGRELPSETIAHLLEEDGVDKGEIQEELRRMLADGE